MKRTPLIRRTPLKRRKVWLSGAGENRELRETWKIRVLHADGYTCRMIGRGDCQGPLEAHHVIPKQALKRYARTAGYSKPQLHALLWNPDNGTALCQRHHRRHENATQRIPQRLLPARAIRFAEETLRFRRILDRHYETDERRDDDR